MRVKEFCRYPPPYFGLALVMVGGRGRIPAPFLPSLRKRGILAEIVEALTAGATPHPQLVLMDIHYLLNLSKK